jgi:hypothetical protein
MQDKPSAGSISRKEPQPRRSVASEHLPGKIQREVNSQHSRYALVTYGRPAMRQRQHA